MQRMLSDLLARAGILGIVAALAAALALLRAAEMLAYTVLDPFGIRTLSLAVADTRFLYGDLLVRLVALLAIATLALLVARNALAELRTCPECRSRVPRSARVCRACTSELEPRP